MREGRIPSPPRPRTNAAAEMPVLVDYGRDDFGICTRRARSGIERGEIVPAKKNATAVWRAGGSRIVGTIGRPELIHASKTRSTEMRNAAAGFTAALQLIDADSRKSQI